MTPARTLGQHTALAPLRKWRDASRPPLRASSPLRREAPENHPRRLRHLACGRTDDSTRKQLTLAMAASQPPVGDVPGLVGALTAGRVVVDADASLVEVG